MEYGNPYNLPGLLSDRPMPDQNAFIDALRRLQLSGGFEQIQQPYVNVTAGGGRIGYAFPMGRDDLTLGASGNMAKVKIDAPGFQDTIRQKNLTGLDASYRAGPNTYGVEWGRGDPMAHNMSQINRLTMPEPSAPMPNMVPQEFLRLFFRKQF